MRVRVYWKASACLPVNHTDYVITRFGDMDRWLGAMGNVLRIDQLDEADSPVHTAPQNCPHMPTDFCATCRREAQEQRLAAGIEGGA